MLLSNLADHMAGSSDSLIKNRFFKGRVSGIVKLFSLNKVLYWAVYFFTNQYD